MDGVTVNKFSDLPQRQSLVHVLEQKCEVTEGSQARRVRVYQQEEPLLRTGLCWVHPQNFGEPCTGARLLRGSPRMPQTFWLCTPQDTTLSSGRVSSCPSGRRILQESLIFWKHMDILSKLTCIPAKLGKGQCVQGRSDQPGLEVS